MAFCDPPKGILVLYWGSGCWLHQAISYHTTCPDHLRISTTGILSTPWIQSFFLRVCIALFLAPNNRCSGYISAFHYVLSPCLKKLPLITSSWLGTLLLSYFLLPLYLLWFHQNMMDSCALWYSCLFLLCSKPNYCISVICGRSQHSSCSVWNRSNKTVSC